MSEDSDIPVIDRILAGEVSLYTQLVDRYKSYCFTIAYRVVENRFDAEEVAQDAFVKAYRNLARFQRTAKFSTWLYRIVLNTAISYKRKVRPGHEDIGKATASERHLGEDDLERNDKRKFLEAALGKLNEADRIALTLFYLQECSVEETAAITGMQVNTVKVRIHRARQRLADALKGILNGEAISL